MTIGISREKVLAYSWTLMMFVLLSVPSLPVSNPSVTWIDKVGHVLIFILWTWIVLLAWNVKKIKSYVFVISIGLVYGLGLEIWQSHIGRNLELYDFLGDGLGISIGVLLYIIGKRN